MGTERSEGRPAERSLKERFLSLRAMALRDVSAGTGAVALGAGFADTPCRIDEPGAPALSATADRARRISNRLAAFAGAFAFIGGTAIACPFDADEAAEGDRLESADEATGFIPRSALPFGD
ncbi:hypothetical protein [Segnochrobactrum spirostomi]|uniref:Uncharacterized protein n=1 Tax=Segnochrobactrum spirostomi TaxID=2608987 RepID=A0A6A7Y1P0_9HYPH|nr:hypothetical protein [Segnochrobactrum spirostomi]MQT12924.1 hypothetical protein [Segnochrobactrum spirostomi]